jgi:hypothetical protein
VREVAYRFKLGDKVRDVVTGYEGIATAVTEWLNKCVRYAVTSQDLHEGKPIEAKWFDEEQLEVVEEKSIVTMSKSTGGPKEMETGARKDPSRV